MKKRRKWQPHVDVFIFSLAFHRLAGASSGFLIHHLAVEFLLCFHGIGLRRSFYIANYFGQGFRYWRCWMIIAVVGPDDL